MTENTWQRIEPVPAQRLKDARRQAHNAVHWLARLANSYLEAGDDNRQFELLWDDAACALRTRTFGPHLAVELRLAELEVQFCESGQPAPHILALEERTPAHVEAWILVELLHRGVDRDRFSKELPYPATDLMLGDHEEHEAETYKAELSALDGWMRNAAAVLAVARQDIGRETGTDLSAQPIVCWPQTFQIGIEIPMPVGTAVDALRIGLSAGDALRPDPFFFAGTKAQALSSDFDPSSVLSVQRIISEDLDAAAVSTFLRERAAAHRKKLAS